MNSRIPKRKNETSNSNRPDSTKLQQDLLMRLQLLQDLSECLPPISPNVDPTVPLAPKKNQEHHGKLGRVGRLLTPGQVFPHRCLGVVFFQQVMSMQLHWMNFTLESDCFELEKS
jgi:hypothetical protein